MPKPKSSRLLVVDDQPINIKLLQRKLEREGYLVETASTGLECLDHVNAQRPDLILLDVMMPEMDGIETCQRLKENPETEDIPIIFITAKSSKEGKLEGLSAGATDYITKPIDLDETLARVKTQLRIQEIYRENVDLQRRLGEARKSAAIGAITQGIAHNLNNLLGVVVGYLDLLKSGYDSPDMVKRSVTLMDQAIQRMVSIIRHLSSIATQERHALTGFPIKELLDNTIARFNEESSVKAPVSLEVRTAESAIVLANQEVFESVLLRILSNAAEAYPRQVPDAERPVQVTAYTEEDQLMIEVLDNGEGIDDRIMDNIFEPFITTKTSVGRGLGLTLARHSLRNLRGDLTVTNRPEGGVVARMRYPLHPKYTDTPVGHNAPLGTALLGHSE